MFLDIAIGVFLAFFISEIYETPSSLTLVIVSVVFTLFPDIDLLLIKVIPSSSKAGKVIGGHRGLCHYPLFNLLVGLFVAFFCGKVLGRFVPASHTVPSYTRHVLSWLGHQMVVASFHKVV
jgi:hypothetical protein